MREPKKPKSARTAAIEESKYKKRQELIEDIGERRLEEISNAAWFGAKQQALRETRHNRYGELSIKSKQKVVASYLYSMLDSREAREKVSAWCLEHPGDMLKMIVNSLPKEIETHVTHEGSVVLVPARMGNVQQWLDAANGDQIEDAEIVDAAEPESDAEAFWNNRVG